MRGSKKNDKGLVYRWPGARLQPCKSISFRVARSILRPCSADRHWPAHSRGRSDIRVTSRVRARAGRPRPLTAGPGQVQRGPAELRLGLGGSSTVGRVTVAAGGSGSESDSESAVTGRAAESAGPGARPLTGLPGAWESPGSAGPRLSGSGSGSLAAQAAQ
jgi:hypothetical protein